MKRKASVCTHINRGVITNEDFQRLLQSVVSKGLYGIESGSAAGQVFLPPVASLQARGHPEDKLHHFLYCLSCSVPATKLDDAGGLACGHTFVLDTERLELYCQQCQDYVYLDEFDAAAVLVRHQLMQQKPRGHLAKPCYIPDNDPASSLQVKRQKLQQAADAGRHNSSSSSPTAADGPAPHPAATTAAGEAGHIILAGAGTGAAAALSCLAAGGCSGLKSPDGFPLGLRGLNNLGNTCFMNSVLQVMIHAPLLADFFLGEGHDPSSCRLTARDKPCLACQMDCMFAEVYSGSRLPFSPAEFLYQWWRHADSLAGYQQQDAHEFYLSLLEGMSAAVVPLPQLQQTPEPAEAIPGSQQQQQDVQHGDARGLQGINGPHRQEQQQQQQQTQQLTTDATDPSAGLGVLGRPAGSVPGLHSTSQAVPQHQQLSGGMPGGLDLQMVTNDAADWQQLQQLLQQQGLDGCWPQAYGYPLQQDYNHHHQQQQYGVYGAGTADVGGGFYTPEPASSPRVTPEPEGVDSPDAAAASLVELLFSGLLRSDVVCSSCGHTSTAHDPFRDVSLDLHVPRPPKLPPAQPYTRTQAAVAALAAKEATAIQKQQQQQVSAAGGGPTATTTAADISPAPAHPAAAELSGVTGGVLGREVTPPLLLVTPSPTPPPSDLMGDYWDNTDEAAADTAAGGQLGSSRLQAQAQAEYSGVTSLSTRPLSTTAAVGAEATAHSTGGSVDARSEVDGDEVTMTGCRSIAPAAAHPHSAAGTDGSALDAVSTGTSITPGDTLSDLAVSGVAAGEVSGEKSPEPSDLCGPAASQSSQQMGVSAARPAGSQLIREHTPEPGSCIGAAAAAEASQNTPQQQQQHLATGTCRESTPQSQHQVALPIPQPHSSASAENHKGAASSLICGVSDSFGHLVRAPVAAVKQLLPTWPGGAATHHQQQQQQQGQQSAAAAYPGEGSGHHSGEMLQNLQKQQQQQSQLQSLQGQGSHLPQDWQQHQYQRYNQQQECVALASEPAHSLPTANPAAAAAAIKLPRQQRCGRCKYCLNRHLKKGCQANKKLRDEAKQAARVPSDHASQDRAAAGVELLNSAAAVAMPAVPLGGAESTATQPTHPLGGTAVDNQQQCLPQQQGWPVGGQLLPQDIQSQQPQWQQQQQQQQQLAPAAAVLQKVRRSPKPAGISTAELLAAAAVSQGVMKKRDERGRFYRKEDLQAWAVQLYQEGRLSVQGLPQVSEAAAAAARARCLPEPPAVSAAQAAAAGQGGQGRAAAPGAAAPGPAVKAGSKAGGAVKKGSAGSGCTTAAAKKASAAAPPQLRMNELSLAGCLRRFVRPERLGPAAQWRCSACGSSAAALKQMSIRRLPLVLCFHVKRFEHGGGTQRPKKLDVPLRFPLRGLDMAPFTSSEVLKGRAGGSRRNTAAAGDANNDLPTDGKGKDKAAAAEEGADVGFQQQCLYELFGVVSHTGDMASGHYVSYVKCDGCWYLINDPWVVAVQEADVAQVQAYMLFYAQQHLFGTGGSSGLVSRVHKYTAADVKQEGATAERVLLKPDPEADTAPTPGGYVNTGSIDAGVGFAADAAGCF